jgi:hypothetical protein
MFEWWKNEKKYKTQKRQNIKKYGSKTRHLKFKSVNKNP